MFIKFNTVESPQKLCCYIFYEFKNNFNLTDIFYQWYPSMGAYGRFIDALMWCFSKLKNEKTCEWSFLLLCFFLFFNLAKERQHFCHCCTSAVVTFSNFKLIDDWIKMSPFFRFFLRFFSLSISPLLDYRPVNTHTHRKQVPLFGQAFSIEQTTTVSAEAWQFSIYFALFLCTVSECVFWPCRPEKKNRSFSVLNISSSSKSIDSNSGSFPDKVEHIFILI